MQPVKVKDTEAFISKVYKLLLNFVTIDAPMNFYPILRGLQTAFIGIFVGKPIRYHQDILRF